jgi:hypothetical protein
MQYLAEGIAEFESSKVKFFQPFIQWSAEGIWGCMVVWLNCWMVKLLNGCMAELLDGCMVGRRPVKTGSHTPFSGLRSPFLRSPLLRYSTSASTGTSDREAISFVVLR